MLQTALSLIVFLFPLAYSPGPGNMFFAGNGARFGFRATIPASTGYHLATWIVTAAMGLGLVSALDRFPGVFSILRVAGALYVLWIAWKLMRAGTAQAEMPARPASFVDGVVLLMLNPKAYVIIAVMFTQFLPAAAMPPAARPVGQVVLITTVFTLNNLIAFSVWTLIGDRIAGYFRSAESARNLNRAFGAVLAGVAVWMLLA